MSETQSKQNHTLKVSDTQIHCTYIFALSLDFSRILTIWRIQLSISVSGETNAPIVHWCRMGWGGVGVLVFKITNQHNTTVQAHRTDTDTDFLA